MHQQNVFENTGHINDNYQKFDKYVKVMYKGFWTPAKYEKGIKKVDVSYIQNSMNLTDRTTIERCILAVLLVEDKVKLYWPTIYNDFPQTIIGDVGGLFGMSEVTHRRSYHSLAKYLDLNIEDYKNHDVIKNRIAYLQKHLENDPKIIGDKRKLKKLVLFSSLVERCSLFTQFYILMSYAMNNKGLKIISSLQQTTATEELQHYQFGIDLINTVKSEKPQLWDDYLIDLVSKNIEDAHKAELKLIDWFFENGTPEHLTKEEVINFLNYNFNKVCSDLELSIRYNYDDELYVKKNEWMLIKCTNVAEPDFFDAPVGGYSSEDENEEESINLIFG